MQFRFSQYQYQTDAANAVCDVFDGQPLQDGVSYIRDTGIRKPLFQEPKPVQDSFDIAELSQVRNHSTISTRRTTRATATRICCWTPNGCSPTSGTCNAGRT